MAQISVRRFNELARPFIQQHLGYGHTEESGVLRPSTSGGSDAATAVFTEDGGVEP